MAKTVIPRRLWRETGDLPPKNWTSSRPYLNPVTVPLTPFAKQEYGRQIAFRWEPRQRQERRRQQQVQRHRRPDVVSSRRNHVLPAP